MPLTRVPLPVTRGQCHNPDSKYLPLEVSTAQSLSIYHQRSVQNPRVSVLPLEVRVNTQSTITCHYMLVPPNVPVFATGDQYNYLQSRYLPLEVSTTTQSQIICHLSTFHYPAIASVTRGQCRYPEYHYLPLDVGNVLSPSIWHQRSVQLPTRGKCNKYLSLEVSTTTQSTITCH